MPKNIATREDWLNLGLKLLNDKGSSALAVESMAKLLEVSKTSFYWYFKTRDNFLLELAEYWAQVGTKSYIESSQKYNSDQEKLYHLIKEVFVHGHNLNSIRFWRDLARTNDAIDRLVNNIESQRLEYLQALLSSKFDAHEASNRADLLYHYFLGWSERHRNITIDESEFNLLWKDIIKPMVTKFS